MTDWTSFHLFCGGGGDGLGFQRAGFTVVGGLDSDEQACVDFEYLTGVEARCADVTDLVPGDLVEYVGGRRPDVVITSPPCKGNSACLSKAQAQTDHYQQLNSLSQLGMWLCLEAWDQPPPLVLLENVDRITSRSREWLDQTIEMLHAYGYAVTESKHDCGELGGLAQHRRRYLLVARHQGQIPAPLFEPRKQRVRGVGEVLGDLPVPIPGEEGGGSMHHLTRLWPITWLRLALIPAGGDYHDLPEEVQVCDGYRGRFGVVDWSGASPTVRANHEVRLAPASTADPRVNCAPRATAYGVTDWQEAAKTILAHACHDNSEVSVADPRAVEPTHAIADDDGTPTLVGPEFDLEGQRSADPVPVILARDGTWHRPMTTLELAALQGFPVRHRGEWLEFAGSSHGDWRERIGNAIPVPAAEAIAKSAMETLEASKNGGFLLGSDPVWVERRGSA